MIRSRAVGLIRRLGLTGTAYRLFESTRRFDPRIAIRNRRYAGKRAADGLPIPPPNLITLVAGTPDIEWFLDYGRATDRATRQLLAKNGRDIHTYGSILDFGCGCGRVVRYWHDLPETLVTGTDYNPRLIDWCRDNLPFGRFEVNDLAPPFAFPDSSVDLVTAYSVFTHLSWELQRRWIAEITRVVTPGGSILITTQGESYVHLLSPEERQAFQAGRLVVRFEEVAGANLCAAFHPRAELERLGGGLSLIDHVPAGTGVAAAMLQDMTLWRKPGETSHGGQKEAPDQT